MTLIMSSLTVMVSRGPLAAWPEVGDGFEVGGLIRVSEEVGAIVTLDI